jgi:hypothetical protein
MIDNMIFKNRDYKILVWYPKAKARYWQFLQKYSRNKAIRKLIYMIDKKHLPKVLNLNAEYTNIPPWPDRPWIQIDPNDLATIRKDVRFIKVFEPSNIPYDKYFITEKNNAKQ